jgi:hypothetical protein
MRAWTMGLLATLLSGCGSTLYSVTPPGEWKAVQSSMVYPEPRDEVWDRAIQRLARRFFVINNIDRASGLINLSYAGEPQAYVDCGTLSVSSAGVEATAPFPLGAANARYAAYVPAPNGYWYLVTVSRQVELEGRINLVFQQEPAGGTRVTVNSRYILRARWGPSFAGSSTTAFNTGGRGELLGPPEMPSTTCVATGALETSILEAIR